MFSHLIRKMISEIFSVKSNDSCFSGCSYGGELARLSGLAQLGEMAFIPRSPGIFCLNSIKKFVRALEKIIWSSIFYNKVT